MLKYFNVVEDPYRSIQSIRSPKGLIFSIEYAYRDAKRMSCDSGRDVEIVQVELDESFKEERFTPTLLKKRDEFSFRHVTVDSFLGITKAFEIPYSIEDCLKVEEKAQNFVRSAIKHKSPEEVEIYIQAWQEQLS